MDILHQLLWLFILAVPVACIAWTVVHEEVFREVHEFCVNKSKGCRTLVQRKFFFLFTCEYCFSHYVTILFLVLTGYKLLMQNWVGYIIAGFALVWVANGYMAVFEIMRQHLKRMKLKNTEMENKPSEKD